MRFAWFVVSLAACHHAKATVAEGEKVDLVAGDRTTIGTVQVDVRTSGDDALVVALSEGARHDTRHVTGSREVKFGAHRVTFDENGSHVTVVVRAYKPSSPLVSEDALLAADEAMSPKSSGPVDCTTALLSADGATFDVHCRDSAQAGTDHQVKVDRVTGAIVSIDRAVR